MAFANDCVKNRGLPRRFRPPGGSRQGPRRSAKPACRGRQAVRTPVNAGAAPAIHSRVDHTAVSATRSCQESLRQEETFSKNHFLNGIAKNRCLTSKSACFFCPFHARFQEVPEQRQRGLWISGKIIKKFSGPSDFRFLVVFFGSGKQGGRRASRAAFISQYGCYSRFFRPVPFPFPCTIFPRSCANARNVVSFPWSGDRKV